MSIETFSNEQKSRLKDLGFRALLEYHESGSLDLEYVKREMGLILDSQWILDLGEGYWYSGYRANKLELVNNYSLAYKFATETMAEEALQMVRNDSNLSVKHFSFRNAAVIEYNKYVKEVLGK